MYVYANMCAKHTGVSRMVERLGESEEACATCVTIEMAKL